MTLASVWRLIAGCLVVSTIVVVSSVRAAEAEVRASGDALARELTRLEQLLPRKSQAIAGWDEDITTATRLEDLPSGARAYVDGIAQAIAVPITLIGTGQGRHQVIDHVGI